MDAQHLLQQRLKQRLVEMKSKNPQTSVRSFARHLKMPAGTISLVLLGKRKISSKLAEKLADALEFDPAERAAIQSSILLEKPLKEKSTPRSTHRRSQELASIHKPDDLRLSSGQFDLLKEWYYFGILSLVQTRTFKNDPAWIAKRLNLLPGTAKNALEQLIQMKLIIIDADGKAKRNYQLVRTSDGILNSSIRKSHEQSLELAKKALRIRQYDECDFTFLNFPADPNDLPEMKEMIRDFQKKLLEKFAYQPNATEVFRVCMQTFPITQPDADELSTATPSLKKSAG